MAVVLIFDVCATYVVGIALLLLNTPTFIALLSSKLRARYAVLAALLLTCALNGVQCLGHATTALFELRDPDSVHQHRDALSCVTDPINLVDQFTFTAVPVMLMVSSIDRWLVFAYPLEYCYRTCKYVVTQIFCAYAFTFLVQAMTIVWTGLYNRTAGLVTCAKTNYMSGALYTLLVVIRVTAASLSILFMLLVLVKLKVRIETTAQYRTDSQLRAFMRRQHSFTNAMLISCGFTLLLFVVPTCVSLYGRFAYPDSAEFGQYTRFVTFFNSFNMVAVVVARTPEIRRQLMQMFCGCTDCSKSLTTIQHIDGKATRA